MRILALALAATIGTAADAATVDLVTGEATTDADAHFSSGYWQGSGFKFRADQICPYEYCDVDADIAQIASGTGGYDEQNIRSLAVDRQDGGSFSVLGISIPWFITDRLVSIQQDIEYPDGTWVWFDAYIYFWYSLLTVTGTKADGTEIVQKLLPANGSTTYIIDGLYSENPEPFFAITGMDDIVSLDLRLNYDYETDADICADYNINRAFGENLDTVSLQDMCASGEIWNTHIRFDDFSTRLNYSYLVNIASIRVSTEEPAPVPLPAAGWLLTAGLMVLGGQKLRRNRPA